MSELVYLLPFIVLMVAIRPSKTELRLMQGRLDSLYKEKADAISGYRFLESESTSLEGGPGRAG